MLLLKAQDRGHVQDQDQDQDPDRILHLTTGKRNIQEAIRTVASSGATTAASGDHTTSEVEDAASSNGDATSVVVGADPFTITTTTTTTSAQTGRITSRTLRKSNDSNSKTIHRVDLTTRNSQEAPLVVTLITQTNPPHHYPDTRTILPLPHTHPLPNAGKPCCPFTITLKM